MRALPPCPACGTALSRERILDDAYVHPQQEGSRPIASCVVACAGCLSTIELKTDAQDDEAPTDARVQAAGAVVTRLRDSLLEMRERGELEGSIPALLADPVNGVLAGVPEIAREILASGVGYVRTSATCYARAGWYSPTWIAPPWKLERYGEYISPADQKLAARDGEFGGFIVPQLSSRVLVLPLQKFKVAGFFGRKARLELPRVAARILPEHPGFQVEWGELVPDRVRRPL